MISKYKAIFRYIKTIATVQLVSIFTVLTPNHAFAEMVSANFHLSSDAVGVSVDLTESSAFRIYSLFALPPVTSDEAINTSSEHVLIGGVDASSLYFGPTFSNASVLAIARGWNLVGSGVDLPLDVSVTFANASFVTSVWKWNAATSKWAFYTPSLQTEALATYAASKGYDLLTTMNGADGFWVNAAQPFSLPISTGIQVTAADFKPEGKRPLLVGWNLVSSGDNTTPAQFNLALSDTPPGFLLPTNIITLWAWDNLLSNWYFYSPALDGNTSLASYIESKGYLDFAKAGKTLGNGVGFWVNKPAAP